MIAAPTDLIAQDTRVRNLEKDIKDAESRLDKKNPRKKTLTEKLIEGAAAFAGGAILAPVIVTASPLVLAGGAIALAGGAFFGSNWLSERMHQNNLDRFKNSNVLLLERKIEILQTCNTTAEIHFVFNRKSTIHPQDKRYQDKPVTPSSNEKAKQAPVALLTHEEEAQAPIKMTAVILNKFMKALVRQSKNNQKPKLKIVDISYASLTDANMYDLLGADLGSFDTEHLILSNNELTDQSIRELKKQIVDKKKVFQNLKRLDLSGNNLTGDCLKEIAEIAKYLNLEELNLSNNKLCHQLNDKFVITDKNNKRLESFFKKQHKRMPSLKSLILQNIGLHKEYRNAVSRILSNPDSLQTLDLRNNPDLTFGSLKQIVEKGLKFNVSLTKLQTDHDALLEFQEILSAHTKLFTDFGYTEATGSRLLFLLNCKLKKTPIPKGIQELLSKSGPADEALEVIVDSILQEREDTLGVDQNLNITITEAEYFHYATDRLPAFYEEIRAGKSPARVDSKLVENIKPVIAKNPPNPAASAVVIAIPGAQASSSNQEVAPSQVGQQRSQGANPEPLLSVAAQVLSEPTPVFTMQFKSVRPGAEINQGIGVPVSPGVPAGQKPRFRE